MATADEVATVVLAQPNINDRYDQLRRLGSPGAFSAVFEARCITTGDQVALKFFADKTNDQYRQYSFAREGRVMWEKLRGETRFIQLREPPAIFSYAAPLPNGQTFSFSFPYLALEWMNGGDAGALAAAPPRDKPTALAHLDCFREMVRAVNRLHNLRCYHRDLKPGNFLISRVQGVRQVKLSDFGTIRIVDEPNILANYHVPVGDQRYTAPEQFLRVDIPEEWYPAADRFALGAILFEILTGQQLIPYTLQTLTSLHLIHGVPPVLPAVPPANRLRVYEGVVENRPFGLPAISTVNSDFPRCAIQVLERLLQQLLDLNFRRRQKVEFSSIIRQVDIARLTISNEIRQQSRH